MNTPKGRMSLPTSFLVNDEDKTPKEIPPEFTPEVVEDPRPIMDLSQDAFTSRAEQMPANWALTDLGGEKILARNDVSNRELITTRSEFSRLLRGK